VEITDPITAAEPASVLREVMGAAEAAPPVSPGDRWSSAMQPGSPAVPPHHINQGVLS
jgi:hypothetical protein